MNLTQAGDAVQWAALLAILLATWLAIDVNRRFRGGGPFLLAAGFSALVASWLVTSYYAAILRFIFGLANPASVFPWQQVAEGLATTAQVLEVLAYLLFAAAILTLGRRYRRHYPRARARTLALLAGSFALLALSAVAGGVHALAYEQVTGPIVEQSSLRTFFAGNGIELIYRAISLAACLLLVLGLLGIRREVRPTIYGEESLGAQ